MKKTETLNFIDFDNNGIVKDQSDHITETCLRLSGVVLDLVKLSGNYYLIIIWKLTKLSKLIYCPKAEAGYAYYPLTVENGDNTL